MIKKIKILGCSYGFDKLTTNGIRIFYYLLKMRTVYHYLIVLFCLILSSCTKQPRITSSSQVEKEPIIQQENELLNFIIQQEAMLVDVPIPLYDERILPVSCDEIEHDTLVFGYKSPLSFSQAIEFFMNQMERYGWQHLISFDSFLQSIVQFKSPDRYCTVIIKDLNDQLPCSAIFIYIKRTSTNARS